ncbi:hypothetical protein ACFYO1_34745 [Nocardia sp. NPDC006044]|uniref:hypothetical protein n=1 Tax=Nocardia sp. NPDC006044 TaxID=3364306 RepID=UPI0036C68AA1
MDLLAAFLIAGVVSLGIVPTPAMADSGLSYGYDFPTGLPQSFIAKQGAFTPANAVGEITRDLNRFFPFRSECGPLTPGRVCNLENLGTKNPIRVVFVNGSVFRFVSLPGHFEGENRYITFTLYLKKQSNFPSQNPLYLKVSAEGPWTPGAQTSVTTGLAYGFWKQFAENIGARAFR